MVCLLDDSAADEAYQVFSEICPTVSVSREQGEDSPMCLSLGFLQRRALQMDRTNILGMELKRGIERERYLIHNMQP